MSRYTARIVLEQISNRPALIAPQFVRGTQALGDGWGVGAVIRDLATADVDTEEAAWKRRKVELAQAYSPGSGPMMDVKPFAFADGKAIIPIHGMLINRFPYSWGGATGYNFIRSQVAAAMSDPDVDGIIYDVNSYGGLVSGCQETSDAMFAASGGQGGKPSLAVVDANCYSAAYYLASAADQIAVTPSGGAGSIGVLMMHIDVSKALDEMGVKVTFIHAGKHKVDGNAFEPLSEQVTRDLQAEIDTMYDSFVATVARNREGLTEKAVRATEARIYQADAAKKVGLVDAVQQPSAAAGAFFQPTNEDISTMATPAQPAANNAAADAAQSAAAGTAAADEARRNERERIRAIHALPEAAGRADLANHLALETELSAEQAKGILTASPKKEVAAAPPAKQEAEPNHFKKAMDNGKHPNVGADSTVTTETADGVEMSRAQQILAAQRKATGFKPKTEGQAA
jgi:signal peptide peptidase SppA